jgi:S-formylglutathione hydrolase FrmB
MAFFSGTVFSNQLRMYTGLHVIVPQTGEREKNVLYLLHGMCDDSSIWSRRTRIEAYAVERDFTVIMPEVHRSFYMDIERGGNYFCYVSEELPEICERVFGIRHSREKTFVAGSSMGGYGALKCALRLPGRYAAAASFSGVLDLKARAKAPDAEKFYPEAPVVFGGNKNLNDDDDLFFLAKKTAGLPYERQPGLLLTCGEKDPYLKDSERFDACLCDLNYNNHTFERWDGGHDWDFWDSSVKRALNFFSGCK